MNPDQKINRAELTRQIIENPAYSEAWMMIRAALIESLSTDTIMLEDTHRTLQNLDRLEKTLNRFYQSGKVEITKRNRFSKSFN
jgi:hypothetical protein